MAGNSRYKTMKDKSKGTFNAAYPTKAADSVNSPPIIFDKQIVDYQIGLTKREHFAAIALQGLLASGKYRLEDNLGDEAVIQADSLIKALNE